MDVGSTVLLACVGFGDPIPSVTWITEDGLLSNNSRITIYESLVTEDGVDFVQSIVEICSVEEADGLEYTCNVRNALGNASVSFDLSVTATGGRYKFIINVLLLLCVKEREVHCIHQKERHLRLANIYFFRPSSDSVASKPDNFSG